LKPVTPAPAYQDKALRNLPCKRVQMDEIWSFVYAKTSNVKAAKNAPANARDTFGPGRLSAPTRSCWVSLQLLAKIVPKIARAC